MHKKQINLYEKNSFLPSVFLHMDQNRSLN